MRMNSQSSSRKRLGVLAGATRGASPAGPVTARPVTAMSKAPVSEPKRAASPAPSPAEKAHFLEFLATKGLKMTRQREAVVDEIIGNPGHFEAEEIVQRLKSNRNRVSRATVYRTLELLQECLLVERLDFGTTHAFYEHVLEGQHHDHLICMRCGNVIEFHNEELERIQSSVSHNFDFAEIYHSLRIFGLCSKCRRSSA